MSKQQLQAPTRHRRTYEPATLEVPVPIIIAFFGSFLAVAGAAVLAIFGVSPW